MPPARTPFSRGTARQLRNLVLGAVTAVSLVACSGSGSSTAPSGSGSSSVSASSSAPSSGSVSGSAPGSSSASASASPSGPSSGYYVSIGDSYAAGYQPSAKGRGSTNRNGFAYQTVALAKAKGYDLDLVNFGCAGATTESVLTRAGCPTERLGPGATPYSGTQAAAAEAFLRAHRGRIALVTVSLGGNDLTACGAAANAVSCVTSALTSVEKNLGTLMTGLRSAAGSGTRIVGTTYPDVLLGDSLSTVAARRSTASLSVLAFRSFINPGLEGVYAAAQAGFVDVTTATGAYLPMTQTTTLAPYGRIPVAVARICQLTFYCEYQDIHPRTSGYAIIAKLIVATLPAR